MTGEFYGKHSTVKFEGGDYRPFGSSKTPTFAPDITKENGGIATIVPSIGGQSDGPVCYSIAPGIPKHSVNTGYKLVPPTADVILSQQMAVVERQKKEMILLESWYGKPCSEVGEKTYAEFGGDSSTLRPSTGFDRDTVGTSLPSSWLLLNSSAPRSAAKIRSRGFRQINRLNSTTSGDGKVNGTQLAIGGKNTNSPDNKSFTQHKMQLLLGNTNITEDVADDACKKVRNVEEKENNVLLPSSYLETENTATLFKYNFKMSTPSSKNEGTSSEANTDNQFNYHQSVIGNPESASVDEETGRHNTFSNAMLPKLTKAGYSTIPDQEKLAKMSEAELTAVSGFIVARAGYGSIAWDGSVDVRGCDLDTVISIESREVAVYDNEESIATKPIVGSKLNRTAVITMCNVFPKEEKENASDKSKMKYEGKVAKCTKRMGAELLSYNSSDGVWKFRVAHF